MSIPFSHKQPFRELFEFLSTGGKVDEEQLSQVAPAFPFPADVIADAKSKCPLSEDAFLAFIAQGQKASTVPWKEIVWGFVTSYGRAMVFEGNDEAELKAVRSLVDPSLKPMKREPELTTLWTSAAATEGKITPEELTKMLQDVGKSMPMLDVFRMLKPKGGKGRGGKKVSLVGAITPPPAAATADAGGAGPVSPTKATTQAPPPPPPAKKAVPPPPPPKKSTPPPPPPKKSVPEPEKKTLAEPAAEVPEITKTPPPELEKEEPKKDEEKPPAKAEEASKPAPVSPEDVKPPTGAPLSPSASPATAASDDPKSPLSGTIPPTSPSGSAPTGSHLGIPQASSPGNKSTSAASPIGRRSEIDFGLLSNASFGSFTITGNNGGLQAALDARAAAQREVAAASQTPAPISKPATAEASAAADLLTRELKLPEEVAGFVKEMDSKRQTLKAQLELEMKELEENNAAIDALKKRRAALEDANRQAPSLVAMVAGGDPSAVLSNEEREGLLRRIGAAVSTSQSQQDVLREEIRALRDVQHYDAMRGQLAGALGGAAVPPSVVGGSPAHYNGAPDVMASPSPTSFSAVGPSTPGGAAGRLTAFYSAVENKQHELKQKEATLAKLAALEEHEQQLENEIRQKQKREKKRAANERVAMQKRQSLAEQAREEYAALQQLQRGGLGSRPRDAMPSPAPNQQQQYDAPVFGGPTHDSLANYLTAQQQQQERAMSGRYQPPPSQMQGEYYRRPNAKLDRTVGDGNPYLVSRGQSEVVLGRDAGVSAKLEEYMRMQRQKSVAMRETGY